ncbi:MAG: 5-formyltetrahydrofolate cyclo-ligase [Campylobacterales bacterium]|nr:5-formyltetrahydrofolate cyclo-ligase [Campylobacterales bacterium]
MKRFERLEQKEQFRKDCLEKLKHESRLPNRYAKDKRLQKRLLSYIDHLNPRTVMLYLPLKIEFDISGIIKKLRKEGRLIYVPFMENESFRLVKYRLPLTRNSCGIEEPKNSRGSRKKNIDLAVVPIVGVDATFRRVGFGKGMYDRFYEKEKQNIATTLFIARYLCVSRDILTDSRDVSPDIIVV